MEVAARFNTQYFAALPLRNKSVVKAHCLAKLHKHFNIKPGTQI